MCLKYDKRFFSLQLDNLGGKGILIALTQLYNSSTIYEFEGVVDPSNYNDPDQYAEDIRNIIAK